VQSLLLATVCGCAHQPPATIPAGTGPGIELSDTPFFLQESHQCGPAALATVLAASGADVTPEQLVPQTYLPGRRGSLQLELIAAARTYRMIPYVIDGTLAALLAEIDARHPVLVLLDLGVGPIMLWHYAVVVGYRSEADEVVLRSGSTKRLTMSVPRFMRNWQKADQWALVALRPDQLPATAEPGRYVASIVPLETLGDYTAAHTAYATALRRWPDDELALFGAANTSHRLGELESAQRDYRRLLALAPDNPFVLNNLAEVLLDRGCPILADRYAGSAVATGELAAAIADTRAKAAAMRAQQGDGPACRE
jgi:tetratricopeptide (TPR) repeat protein